MIQRIFQAQKNWFIQDWFGSNRISIGWFGTSNISKRFFGLRPHKGPFRFLLRTPKIIIPAPIWSTSTPEMKENGVGCRRNISTCKS
jgi:hypothetical protein